MRSVILEQDAYHGPRLGEGDIGLDLPEPGLFRIVVSGGGTTPVSQLVMAEQPGDDPPDDDE